MNSFKVRESVIELSPEKIYQKIRPCKINRVEQRHKIKL